MKPLKFMICAILLSSVGLMLYAGYLGRQHPDCAEAAVVSMILTFIGLAGVMGYDGSEP